MPGLLLLQREQARVVGYPVFFWKMITQIRWSDAGQKMITQIKRSKANDNLTGQIIGCCFRVHKALGPGFPEKVYQEALAKALRDTGLEIDSERYFEVCFEGAPVGTFRVDLLVDGKVVVEIKAVTGLLPRVFVAQLLAYLKAAKLPIGLLVNFGNESCQVKRVVNSSAESVSV